MKKKLLIFWVIVIAFILGGGALIVHDFIAGWTPTFKDCGDFSPEEIKIIEEELSFELGDNAKIVNARFTHARETKFLLWIKGIEDKNEFIKNSNLKFKNSGKYDVSRDIDEWGYQEAELYTSSKNEAKWYLYKDGNTWSAYVDNSRIGEKTEKLFDRVKNQY